MSVLRNYSKAGSLNWTQPAAPVQQGGLCYIGAGKFAAMDSRASGGVYITEIAGPGGMTVEKQLIALTGATGNGRGVTMEYNGAGKLLVTARHDVPPGLPVRQYMIRCYDIVTGALDWEVSRGPSNAEGGIAFNGTSWWVSFTNTSGGGTNVLTQMDIAGSTVTAMASWDMATATPAGVMCQDMCFDGNHLYTLQGTNIIVYEMAGNNAPVQLYTFALAAGAPLGLATDGNSLYVMART